MSQDNQLKVILKHGATKSDGIVVTKQLQKGSEESAGYDILSNHYYTLEVGEQALIKTGIFSQIEVGWVGICKERSGLALRKSIRVLGGVIDSDYRGEWGIILKNDGDKPFEIVMGDKIAQVVFVRHGIVSLEFDSNLSDSLRGEGGYGSTGR